MHVRGECIDTATYREPCHRPTGVPEGHQYEGSRRQTGHCTSKSLEVSEDHNLQCMLHEEKSGLGNSYYTALEWRRLSPITDLSRQACIMLHIYGLMQLNLVIGSKAWS